MTIQDKKNTAEIALAVEVCELRTNLAALEATVQELKAIVSLKADVTAMVALQSQMPRAI